MRIAEFIAVFWIMALLRLFRFGSQSLLRSAATKVWWGEWDAGAGQGGGVVGVPGFGVAEFAAKAAVLFAGEWLAARAFVNPGFVGWRRTRRAGCVGEPATAGVGSQLGAWSVEPGG